MEAVKQRLGDLRTDLVWVIEHPSLFDGNTAESRLFFEKLGTWDDEHSLALSGADLLDAGRYIQRHMQIDVEPETIVEELVCLVAERLEDAVPWRPGARELLLELVDAGLLTVAVTAVPLDGAAAAWDAPTKGRLVLVP